MDDGDDGELYYHDEEICNLDLVTEIIHHLARFRPRYRLSNDFFYHIQKALDALIPPEKKDE